MADTKISALTSATTPLAGTEVLPIVQSGTTKKVSVANLTAGRDVAATNVTATNGSITAGNAGVVLTGRYDQFYPSPNAGYFQIQTNNLNATDGGLSIFTATSGAFTEKFKIESSGNATFYVGNLIQGTAAKGVNFTANTPAAGMTSRLLNWYEEGTWTPSVGGNATYTIQSGHYTRIGRQVTVRCDMAINVIGTGSTKYLTGLPFTPAQSSAGALGYFADLNGTYVVINPLVTTSNNIIFETMTAAGSVATDETAIFKSGTRVIVTATYFV